MVMSRRTLIDRWGPPMRMQVVEGAQSGKLVVEGKIGQVEKPTANNRMYPRSVMEREINRLKPRIEQGSVLGAVDHPGDGRSRVRESGCIVRGLWIESNGEIRGRFEVVEESDAGRNLAAFLRRGAAIGMSSRGVGSTTSSPEGYDIVGEDFRLNTWDFVADPACHDAYPAIISEEADAEGNPTGKITVDPKKLSEIELRQYFPDLVQSIEEHALAIGSETCVADTEERLRGEIEDQVETGIAESRDEIRASVKLEIEEEVRKELEDDFATKLVRALAEIREDVTEEVRSEIDSDPANAQAKTKLAKVAEMVSPFTPDPDTKKMLAERDAEISALRDSVDEAHSKLEQTQTERDELNQKAKELAYAVFVERKIGNRQDAERLREMIGDVSQYRSAEALASKIESALATADEMSERALDDAERRWHADRTKLESRLETLERERDRARREADRIRTTTAKQIESVETRLQQILEDRTQAEEEQRSQLEEERIRLGEAAAKSYRGALIGYAAKRTLGHPHQAVIIERVERGLLTSKNDVDEACSELEENAEGPGGVGERMRRALSRGRETPLEEDQRPSVESFVPDEIDHDLHFLGTSLQEQEQLAGRIRPSHDSRR